MFCYMTAYQNINLSNVGRQAPLFIRQKYEFIWSWLYNYDHQLLMSSALSTFPGARLVEQIHSRLKLYKGLDSLQDYFIPYEFENVFPWKHSLNYWYHFYMMLNSSEIPGT